MSFARDDEDACLEALLAEDAATEAWSRSFGLKLELEGAEDASLSTEIMMSARSSQDGARSTEEPFLKRSQAV